MENILNMTKIENLANMLYPFYAEELDAYIKTYKTTGFESELQLKELKICADNYFQKASRIEYGYVYLANDSVHFVNPFCPDREDVRMDRREWFRHSFSYEELDGLLEKRLTDFRANGNWYYTDVEISYQIWLQDKLP